MKWLFLTVLVLVAGGVAAFAIYTFGWRGTDGAADRARAQLIALRIASEACTTCQAGQLEHRAGTVWNVQVKGERYQACWTFDTDKFSGQF